MNLTTEAIALTDIHGEITNDADTIKRVKAALKKSFADVTVRRHFMSGENDRTSLLIAWNDRDEISGDYDRRHLELDISDASVSNIPEEFKGKLHTAFAVEDFAHSSLPRQIARAIKPGATLRAQVSGNRASFWIGNRSTGNGQSFPCERVSYFN